MTTATHWPEADSLFRSDPRWRGSDDAYSIPLGPDRILWMFGDTFVAPDPDTKVDGRIGAHFPRNTVGIQTGTDPSSASIKFHWRTKPDGSAGSVFDLGDATWLWPLDGKMVGDKLLLFFMHVRSSDKAPDPDPIAEWRKLGSLGFFDVFDYVAMMVSNPQDNPSQWQIQRLDTPTIPGTQIVGGALLIEEDWLYAYTWDPRWSLTLARWPLSKAGAGDLATPEWFTNSGWSEDPSEAALVIENGATELTVHRADDGRLWQTQILSVRDMCLVSRFADKPEGPWSEPTRWIMPEESQRTGIFLYAGKAHPELDGADLVLTYASNADVDTVLADTSVYYPRFAKVSF